MHASFARIAVGKESSAARIEDKNWFGRLYSNSSVEVRIPNPQAEPNVKPAIYQHAMAVRSPQPGACSGRSSKRSCRRSRSRTQGDAAHSGAAAQRNHSGSAVWRRVGSETVTQLKAAAWNVLVEGLPDVTRGAVNFSGSVDVSADRMVIWSSNTQPAVAGGTTVQQERRRRWSSTWKATLSSARATASCRPRPCTTTCKCKRRDSRCRSCSRPCRSVQGLLRLKSRCDASARSRIIIVAENASFTTSRLGVPTYEFKSGTLMLEDNQRQAAVEPRDRRARKSDSRSSC